MLEKLSQMAEQAATSASRRQFFGRAANGALALAGVLEKISQLAEQAATSASRRQFLDRFGRGAMTLAAIVGGALAFPNDALAGGRACSGELTDAVCVGKNVGDLCSSGGLTGKCKRAPNCYCAIRYEGH